jgi:hypothetical protein
MLDAIQKLSKETRRAAAARRACASPLHPNKDSIFTSRTVSKTKKSRKSGTKFPQIYRPNEEFDSYTSETTKQAEKESKVRALKQQESIAEREKELTKELNKVKADNTLLGTCRAVRSQHCSTRHSFLPGASAYNGSLFLDSTPSLPLVRETSLNSHFNPFCAYSYEGIRNRSVALLELTDDKQLKLSKPLNALIQPSVHVDVLSDKAVTKKRDIVTKL